MVNVRRGTTGLLTIAAIVVAGLVLGACQAPTPVLRGTVTTASGCHPAEIQVAVYSNTTGSIVAQATTNTAGEYSFLPDERPDGTYRILFATSDWWNNASTWADASPVEVSVAAPAVTGGFNPLPGVAVAAIDSTSGSTIATTATASDGTYTFGGLPTGGYVFRFIKSGYTTRYNNAAGTKATAPVVTVTDGTNPAAGVLVLAFDPSSGDALGATATATAGNGTFILTGLDARAYTVGFIDGSHQLHSLIYGLTSGNPTTGTPVTPTSGTIDLGTIALVASTAPGAPIAASATPGDGQATITWSAPADDGGAPITGYTVTASTGETCDTTGALSCVVTGLTNGTAISFTVTATNMVGTGPSSAASAKVHPEPADYCTQDHSDSPYGGTQFTNADLTGADFTGANLTDAILTGTTLTGATLAGVASGDITGTPAALPTGWTLVGGVLVPPTP